MKLFLTDQTSNFEKLLAQSISKPVMKFDKSQLKEKVSIVEIQVSKILPELDLAFFFNYKIFPPDILTFLTQWQLEKREMKVGDTILQQVYLPPVKPLSQKIIFAVRINQIIHETNRKGFSYETVEGHVEKGESTFTIEQLNDKVIFKIQTFSEPGNLLVRVAAPFLSMPYQAYCTRKALENVKTKLQSN